MRDIANIKAFIQIWIVMYFYHESNVIVHVPSSLQSIDHILNYLKNTNHSKKICVESLLKLLHCIDNEQLLNIQEIEQIAEEIRSFELN